MVASSPPVAAPDRLPPTVVEAPDVAAVPAVGPRLSAAEAATLPAKLQWTLIGWFRASGDLETAAALLDGIEARSGETGQLLEERARLALAAGRGEEAVGLMAQRVERAPSASARAGLARFHLELGDVATAAAISADLCRDHPDLATVAALTADVARAAGDLVTARAYHEGILEERPEQVGALLALARLALLGGDQGRAAALLDRALAATAEATAATPAQLFAAAAVADFCERPTQAGLLRVHAARLEAGRAAALARTVDEALGRSAEEGWWREEAVSPAPPSLPRPMPVPAAAPVLMPVSKPSTPRPTPAPSAPVPPPSAVTALADVAVDPRVLARLKEDFGFDGLRPGQAMVIANVLAGKDTLAIMPTGAGKSLTFQLPALLLEGTTLVISPLIALMKDQVESLPAAVRERTALVNSTLSPDEQRRVLDRLADGAYKLVYAAPERLRQHAFVRALRETGVSLVVVDEAHCISMWGHDFRPDYLAIPTCLPELGDPPLLAITATATPRMADAIAGGFGRELARVRTSVFRSNLFYEAHRVANREEKVAKTVAVCREERGNGIVYVSSRKDTESIAAVLRDRGVGAVPYHAGLDPETRARNQERFMRGQVRVVVATVAFGMGVDKADVRFIVHLTPPRSLEAYAQESGRAGRDGEPARCVLLVAPSDQASMNRFARRDELDIDAVRRVYAGVKRAATGRWAIVDPTALLPPPAFDGDGDDDPDPRIALGLLAQADLVRRHPDAPVSFALRLGEAPSETDEPADDDPAWRRFAAWAGLEAGGGGGATVRTAEACEALDLSPVELARLLNRRPDLLVREGPRLVCLELLPVGGDAGHRLKQNLAQSAEEARQRIAQVMAYAAGGRCRHVLLANHLGERLEPCGTACDVCAGTVTAAPARGVARSSSGGGSASRGALTAADALAVIEAVKTLPFSMGKTGLTKLLVGSVESRVRADRSASFAALEGVPKGKVDALIDRLVEDGFLHRDQNHEFKLVTVTERGGTATVEDLGAYAAPGRSTAVASLPDDVDLDPDGVALLERLHAWRRERAVRDAVPPYVVAHNATLQAIAAARPGSASRLAEVKGFGPARVEKYGDEILALVDET